MKSNKPTLCVAIIARNAARQLHETLLSVRQLTTEIAVLETGSTDTTAEAAALGGAQVVRHLWDDNFAGARNALLPHLQAPWILWLDAGETLLPDDVPLLQQFVQQYADDSRAYYLRVATPANAGQIGGEQIARLRLHPNRPGLIFHGRVRESMQRSLNAFNLEAEHLPLTIQRGAQEHDPEVKAARARRNIHLADLQISQRGPTADLLNCLGEAFQAIGDSVHAEQHYRRALELSSAQSTEMLEAYYGLLTCLSKPDSAAEQMQLCLAGLEQFPLDAQLLCALGGYLQGTQRFELAIRSFTLAAEHGQINTQLWHLPEIREIATSCQAQLLLQNGQLEASMLALDQALARYPHSQRLQVQRQKLMGTQQVSIAEPETLRAMTEQHKTDRTRVDESAASAMPAPRLQSSPLNSKPRASQR
ncbi:glycosyltransferase [Anatilimnocola sp. NA78]|uniref:glycosyltransferase n=1 Tax=Anatilimnocola sp. NA78 TaxID=3415683 RepID=UPI003CE5A29A